jgi:bacillithiol biosynthesis deacetylase BshB1
MVEQQGYRYDVLAIGAHPDDIEHAIGATLLRLRDQGKRICLAHMTHGEAGTFGSAALRDEEARAAARYLNADVHWLDFPDTQIQDTPEARRRVVQFIREIRPRLIFCHYYEYPLMHPDHEATGSILKAAFRLCRFRNFETGNEPFWIPNIAYYLFPETVRPSFVVDVTDYMEKWEELANCYASQFHNIPNYRERLITRKRAAGLLIDVAYGEAFYCDRPVNATRVDLTQL